MKGVNISNGRIASTKYAKFLLDIYILNLKLLDIADILNARHDRTIEYFKALYKHIFVKLIF